VTDIKTLADRYVAVWNETDPDARRATVEQLWAPDAVEYTETKEHRGHDGLEKRVISAYDELVAGQGYRFHLDGPVVGHHDMVTFRTTMTPAAGGDVAWIGLMVLRLDADGRIREDGQFTVG
jgi:uncharacterized protein